MAGLRTKRPSRHRGATLFVLLSAYRFATTSGPGGIRADSTRVDAQIVSGIRFLGAGVILPDGLTVRGLNTAATPWCSAAVGALARAGMSPIAVLSTAAVITANGALRPLGRRPDRHPTGGTEITVDYRFQAVCANSPKPTSAPCSSRPLPAPTSPSAPSAATTPTDHPVTVTADLTADHRDDRQLETAVSRPSLEPAVTAVSWTVLTPRRHRGQRQRQHPTAQRAEPTVLATAPP